LTKWILKKQESKNFWQIGKNLMPFSFLFSLIILILCTVRNFGGNLTLFLESRGQRASRRRRSRGSGRGNRGVLARAGFGSRSRTALIVSENVLNNTGTNISQ
jgi:hypothetical protein